MVCDMVAVVVKTLRVGVCYGGFYSRLRTMLRNHWNQSKGRGCWVWFSLHLSIPDSVWLVYNGEAIGDGVTIGHKGHHGDGGVAAFPM